MRTCLALHMYDAKLVFVQFYFWVENVLGREGDN